MNRSPYTKDHLAPRVGSRARVLTCKGPRLRLGALALDQGDGREAQWADCPIGSSALASEDHLGQHFLRLFCFVRIAGSTKSLGSFEETLLFHLSGFQSRRNQSLDDLIGAASLLSSQGVDLGADVSGERNASSDSLASSLRSVATARRHAGSILHHHAPNRTTYKIKSQLKLFSRTRSSKTYSGRTSGDARLALGIP